MGALRFSNIFKGLGPKIPESSNADWVKRVTDSRHSPKRPPLFARGYSIISLTKLNTVNVCPAEYAYID